MAIKKKKKLRGEYGVVSPIPESRDRGCPAGDRGRRGDEGSDSRNQRSGPCGESRGEGGRHLHPLAIACAAEGAAERPGGGSDGCEFVAYLRSRKLLATGRLIFGRYLVPRT